MLAGHVLDMKRQHCSVACILLHITLDQIHRHILSGKQPQAPVMLCGILLRPILSLDREELALALREYHSVASELTGDWEAKENELLRPYIQEKCRAYILDEAQRLGLTNFECFVRLKWRDESWVPYEITLTGNASDQVKKKLGERLDAELGVPAERQFWNAVN